MAGKVLKRAPAVVARLLLGGVMILGMGETTKAEVTDAAACRVGEWLLPASGLPVAHAELLAGIAAGDILLLGEYHDNARHHRWQAGIISGLLARGVPLSLGFEAFPRRLQPVLDRWVAGELDEPSFLIASEWETVWGFDWQLYLPLFELARLHRLPMVALNVERSLVSRVGREGWEAIPAAEREGVGEPAPAPDAYAAMLRDLLASHHPAPEAGDDATEVPKPAIDEDRARRFVQAQTVWDRAMAEALADNHHPARVIVGIAGSGHLRQGHGIAHQLAALGYESKTWLPVAPEDCTPLEPELADAAFVIDAPPAPPPTPRLGIGLAAGDAGVRITSVAEGSVAQATGLLEGDTIRSAAGSMVAKPGELAAIIRQQAPGSWLPLVVERAGRSLALVARLPPPE